MAERGDESRCIYMDLDLHFTLISIAKFQLRDSPSQLLKDIVDRLAPYVALISGIVAFQEAQ